MSTRPSPRLSYLIALGVVALLSVGAYALLSQLIRAQQGSAAAINLSGRQRMLSQRTALGALRLATAPTAVERAGLRVSLSRDLAALMTDHAALLSGDPARGLPGAPPATLKRYYTQAPASLNARLDAYAA